MIFLPALQFSTFSPYFSDSPCLAICRSDPQRAVVAASLAEMDCSRSRFCSSIPAILFLVSMLYAFQLADAVVVKVGVHG